MQARAVSATSLWLQIMLHVAQVGPCSSRGAARLPFPGRNLAADMVSVSTACARAQTHTHTREEPRLQSGTDETIQYSILRVLVHRCHKAAMTMQTNIKITCHAMHMNPRL
jgi:hypothetical protein